MSQILYDSFIGEFIRLTTKLSSKIQNQTETEIETQESPIMLDGYLVDMDDKYFYLGMSPDTITCAIEINTVAFLQILQELNPLENILDNLPDETDPDKMN